MEPFGWVACSVAYLNVTSSKGLLLEYRCSATQKASIAVLKKPF